MFYLELIELADSGIDSAPTTCLIVTYLAACWHFVIYETLIADLNKI